MCRRQGRVMLPSQRAHELTSRAMIKSVIPIAVTAIIEIEVRSVPMLRSERKTSEARER